MNEYKQAGVDVEAGYKSVELMKKHVEKTFNKSVLSGLGGFGGLFMPDLSGYRQPVLVSGTDGVGTKLKLAFVLDKHDTIGIDAVAMCVNDIICSGAKPLFFLDYIACGKNYPEKIELILKGISDGCIQSDCAIVGGETAEMPGFYALDEYDLAGFAVGIVDKDKIIDKSKITEGDVLIGLPSSGVHSNGFSLVRKIVGESLKELSVYHNQLNQTIGASLLTPTKIYVKEILDIISQFNVKGISHITGGGFIENIPRMLPDGLAAKITMGSWPVLPIFKILETLGNVDEKSMFNTFNMGIGMVLAVREDDAKNIVSKYNGYIIGSVIKSDEPIIFV
ncbi:MAG: phosphoribosylformylglycinamidine cyclo-ligase [Clostridia bacterium]|nr:phosphoribosylformylglycinamidine cyclo-ligase [Clostridia bacterium]